MAVLWRLVHPRRVEVAFDPDWARRGAGRWHRRGDAVVYAGDHPSTCVLEILVHLKRRALLEPVVPAFRLEIDDAWIEHLDPEDLPADWRVSPWPLSTQALGSAFCTRGLQGRARPILAVPSAVVPTAVNYVIHLAHPAWASISLPEPRQLVLDARLGRGR